MGEINIVLWQNNRNSQEVATVIEQGYGPLLKQLTGQEIGSVQYMAFAPNEAEGVLGLDEVCQRYQEGKVQMLVIPIANYIGQSMLVTEAMARGVKIEDFYLAKRILSNTFSMEELAKFITPLIQSKYMPYLEFHVADHCNLNCKACEHYSGLVHEEVLPNYEKFAHDLQRLHTFVDDIGMIRILGGEPLLNPEIERYVRLVYQLYPNALRDVVTNGLKLLSMPDSFYDTLRETDTNIWMSYYPPVQGKRQEIEEKLKEQKVGYGISELNTEFTMKQVLKPLPGVEHFYHCMQAHCNNLYDGQVAACFLPFTTKYFNREFQQNLPEDGGLDLYREDMSTEMLQRHLFTPFQRCKYCNTQAVPVKWDICKTPSELKDWVVE